MHKIFIIAFVLTETVFSAIPLTPIPRKPMQEFVKEGVFEGGTQTPANLEAIRIARHEAEGFERWVIDFSDPEKRKTNSVAPSFQVQYRKSEVGGIVDGDEVRKPAKFLFIFRSIQKNFVKLRDIKNLEKRSKYVNAVFLYPPIEEGDVGMELVLRDDVAFQVHQPVENPGRIVLDIRK